MTALAFLDLDNTLVFPERAFTGATGSYRCVDSTVDRQVSFATARAIALLNALPEVGIQVVPTTARSSEQLMRMTLFSMQPPVAIIAGGAGILLNGAPDVQWQRLLQERLVDSSPVPTILEELQGRVHSARRVAIREGYLVVLGYDTTELAAADGAEIGEWVRTQGWVCWADGRRVYLSPEAISKASAARHVAKLYSTGMWAAAGDSALDVELLSLAGYAVAPAGSWAASQEHRPSSVEVTNQIGPNAAEEICERIALALTHHEDS